MLPENTVILPNVRGDVEKCDVKHIVGELYKAECQFSILPDDKVRDAVRDELLNYLLSIPPAQVGKP